MRFLFTTIPGSGHFHPMVPTAQALQRRGHEVVFAASPSFQSAVETAGFEFHPAGPAWLEQLDDPLMQKILAGEFFVDMTRLGMVEGVVQAAEATQPDAIVRGEAEIGALMAAAIVDLPLAANAAAGSKMYWPLMHDWIVRAAAEHGLDGERLVADDFHVLRIDRTPDSLQTPGYVTPDNGINVQPEPFDGGGDLPPWVGELNDRPLVFVTLGTVFNGNVPLFRLIADALAGEPYEVIVALGRSTPPEAVGPVASNIHLGGYLPQGRILEIAAAVVNHGGYNTVSAALGAGVPLFLLPMGADQPFNTERCIEAGAGLGVIQDQPPGPPQAGPPPFTPPAPEVIRDGVRRLLDEPGFRRAAERVAAEIAAMPPVDAAAERLEAEVGRRQQAGAGASAAVVRA
jgi:UDP:flavonoid glycosyltransferase YjiC (YdhE family)